jgi:uncharacterized protein (TIGR03435 family)
MRSGRSFVDGKSVTMNLLARTLSMVLERPVLNRTGINGQYEVRRDWTPDPGWGRKAPDEGARTHSDDDLEDLYGDRNGAWVAPEGQLRTR